MNKLKSIIKNFWFVISSLIIIGLVFLYFSTIVESNKTFFSSLASVLIITGVFKAFDRIYLEEKLLESIMAKVQLKKNLDEAGIEEVFFNIRYVNYHEYIENSNEIDIIHNYGNTWTRENIEVIEKRVRQTQCKIRVFLLSPDSKHIPGIAHQYNETPEELKERINNVTNQWKKLKNSIAANGSKLDVYYHDSVPSIPLYRFNNKMVLVFNRVSKSEKHSPPLTPAAILFTQKQPTDFFSSYMEDIDKLESHWSIKVGE